jgi:hypothetical protein
VSRTVALSLTYSRFREFCRAYFLFPVTGTLADPKPVLVCASIAGSGVKVLPLEVVNATALVYLSALGKLVVISQVSCCFVSCFARPSHIAQEDVLTVDVTTGTLTPNHIPFPGTEFLNTGVATSDGAQIFLLFGQDPSQVDSPEWFIGVIDLVQASVVKGSTHSVSKFPPPLLSLFPSFPPQSTPQSQQKIRRKYDNEPQVPYRYALECSRQRHDDPHCHDEYT